MKKTRSILAGLLLASGSAACTVGEETKEEGPSETYEATPVSGKIGGASWAMAGGRILMETDPDLPNHGHFEFYSQAFTDPCDTRLLEAADKKVFSMLVEVVLGEQDLGFTTGKSASFADGSGDTLQINAVGQGKTSLDAVAATSVSGKVIAFYDTDHSVNGTFTLPRCCTSDKGATYALCGDAAP